MEKVRYTYTFSGGFTIVGRKPQLGMYVASYRAEMPFWQPIELEGEEVYQNYLILEEDGSAEFSHLWKGKRLIARGSYSYGASRTESGMTFDIYLFKSSSLEFTFRYYDNNMIALQLIL